MSCSTSTFFSIVENRRYHVQGSLLMSDFDVNLFYLALQGVDVNLFYLALQGVDVNLFYLSLQGVDEKSQKDWYKKMYQSLHKTGDASKGSRYF